MQSIDSPTHGTAIACSLVSYSGEPYSTENYLQVLIVSSHRLLAHGAMLSLLRYLNLRVIIGESQNKS